MSNSGARVPISIVVNGKDYPMTCAPGEEVRIATLGKKLDAAARKIANATPMSESRLLVMAALIVADEVAGEDGKVAADSDSDDDGDSDGDGEDDGVAERIESAAARVEGLAGEDSK